MGNVIKKRYELYSRSDILFYLTKATEGTCSTCIAKDRCRSINKKCVDCREILLKYFNEDIKYVSRWRTAKDSGDFYNKLYGEFRKRYEEQDRTAENLIQFLLEKVAVPTDTEVKE